MPILLRASITDLILISAIFLIVTAKNKNIKWINKPSKLDYATIVILGILTATVIELNALTLGRWSYVSSMPTVFGIGLSPLIQLATTSLIALWLIRKN